MTDRTTIPEYRLYREVGGEAVDFWIHCEPLPDRSRLHRFDIAAHRHPSFFQIFLITAGEGEIVQDSAVQRLEAPCIVFIPSGAVHGFRFSQAVDGIVVTALAERLASLAGTDRQVAAFVEQVRVLSGSDEAASLVLRIDREMKERMVGLAAALEALVALAVVELSRLWVARGIGEPNDARLDDARAQILDALVGLHFRDGQPASFYAAKLSVSVSQLNRIARSLTGQTLQGLIARRLTDAACRDLVFTPTPVAAIAESLGFADPAYFNRFFKRQLGITPGAYRTAERSRLETT